MNNVRLALLTLLLFAVNVFGDLPSYSAFAQVQLDKDEIETEVFVVTLDQLTSIYQPSPSPLVQKTEHALMHERAFLVVRIVNRSSSPITGRMRVIGKWNGGVRSVMDVHYLPARMEQPDYFVVPDQGILAADRTTKPEFEVEWVELRRVSARECKKRE